MKTKKFFSILLTIAILSLLVLTNVSTSYAATAPTVYVYRTGSGDYYCDGSADQVQIQQAIDYVLTHTGFTTIHLKPGTYVVDDTIYMGGKNSSTSPVILEGEGDNTIIQLASTVQWTQNKSMIQQKSGYLNYFKIRNLKLDGNGPNVTHALDGSTPVTIDYDDPNDRGQYWYNLIYLTGCDNLEFNNLTLTHNFNDGVKLSSCDNVEFHDNIVDEIGHDGLYASNCTNLNAYNNTMYLQTNCGIRFYNTNASKMYDNVITVGNGGGAGLQVQKYGSVTVNDVEIYGNRIYNTVLAGIWVFAQGSYTASTANVNIHNNIIYNTGNAGSSYTMVGGITIQGFNATIKNNTIDGCYGWGISARTTNGDNQVSGFTATIKNNIVTYSQDKPQAGGTNYGIRNELASGAGSYTFNLYNNCVYGNDNNYQNVAHSTDINSDPKYADRTTAHDYHLKSAGSRWTTNGWVSDYNETSPCINAGVQSDDALQEPPDNVIRINIGRYGNTSQASTIVVQSSGSTPTPTPTPTPSPGTWYSSTNFASQQNLGTGNTGTAVTMEFDVTPLYSNTSGVIGYADSSTTIDSFSDMAMILSMDSDHYFYARNGGSYAKSANVSFSANTSYHIKIVGNMTAKTYDVFITPSGGSQTQIANDYAFRSDAPTTDDVGKVCLNSATTNSNDFRVQNHTVSTGSSSQSATFNPTADAYVRGGSYASTNYGTSTALEVKVDTNTSYLRKSYLKFNFGSLSASSASNAKLRVYVSATDGDASTIKLYGNSTESWTETGITWNNAPAASTYIASINVSATAGQWYEVNVTSYINNNMSDKLVSFELINEGTYTAGNKTTFNSREVSSNKPELVITY